MCQQTKGAVKPGDDVLYERLLLKQQQLSEILLDHIVETSSVSEGNRSVMEASAIKELLRIIGGTPALEGEFNECYLIGTRNINGTINWSCTGVLIHPKLVVSAAHCIKPGKAYVVALQTNNQNNLGYAEIINCRKTIVHPHYSADTNLNDLSLLIIQNPAQTAPVPIAPLDTITQATEVELVGFGNDHITINKGFGIKRKVSVDIVSIRRSEIEDLNMDESLYGYESDLEFVAGGKGFDTCNGDSGGPAYIVHGANRWVAGLTSRATENRANPCGDGGIYTRLDAHASYINSIIQTL